METEPGRWVRAIEDDPTEGMVDGTALGGFAFAALSSIVIQARNAIELAGNRTPKPLPDSVPIEELFAFLELHSQADQLAGGSEARAAKRAGPGGSGRRLPSPTPERPSERASERASENGNAGLSDVDGHEGWRGVYRLCHALEGISHE